MRAVVIALGLGLGLGLVLAAAAPAFADGEPGERNFAGSVQLDYLAVPSQRLARESTFDGATVELSLRLATDFGEKVTSNVKVCVACHGLEVGQAYFDIHVKDELNLRVGRFTPAFGSFPIRHDPANHRTSDKPLPYDMGRMMHFREWNEGVLPTPWVDNGIELNGTHYFNGGGQLDYAVYAIAGPKGSADAFDFDYTLSRSGDRYYVDNNSEPSGGARMSATIDLGATSSLAMGASAMAGRYDTEAKLDFAIVGADVVLRLDNVFLRAEYLLRRTRFALGEDPEARLKYGPNAVGTYEDFSVRDGFYAEAEAPIGKLDLIARWDGLRRIGNLPASSELRSNSVVLRYTAGLAYRVIGTLRLKTSVEVYDFSDFEDEVAVHTGIAGPF
jgi:hypothetical protein